MSIYEKIRNETEHAIAREADKMEAPDLKGCTVRLRPEYIDLIDKLAEALDETRQSFLSSLIYDAVEEALEGHASVFNDPESVIALMRKECGLPVYGDISEGNK